MFPQDSRSLLQAGWILARLGRFDEAGPVFDSAVAWDPRNGPIRVYQGHYLRMKGDNAAAAAAYRAALALGPDPEAAKSLAEIEGGRAPVTFRPVFRGAGSQRSLQIGIARRLAAA